MAVTIIPEAILGGAFYAFSLSSYLSCNWRWLQLNPLPYSIFPRKRAIIYILRHHSVSTWPAVVEYRRNCYRYVSQNRWMKNELSASNVLNYNLPQGHYAHSTLIHILATVITWSKKFSHGWSRHVIANRHSACGIMVTAGPAMHGTICILRRKTPACDLCSTKRSLPIDYSGSTWGYSCTIHRRRAYCYEHNRPLSMIWWMKCLQPPSPLVFCWPCRLLGNNDVAMCEII